MLNCLRFLRILPPIDREQEKDQLLAALENSVKRAKAIVNELKADYELCSADIRKQYRVYNQTKDVGVKADLKHLMSRRQLTLQQLNEAHIRLAGHQASLQQMRFNLANVDDAKQIATINKTLKKLDVNIDKLADDQRKYAELLSDQQRASDGTRPFSSGGFVLDDDQFEQLLQDECKQLEPEFVIPILKSGPPVPSSKPLVDNHGAMEIQDDGDDDVTRFLITDENAEQQV